MKKLLITLTLTLFSILLVNAQGIKWLSIETVANNYSQIPTIVYFYSNECEPCNDYDKQVLQNSEVINFINQNFRIAKVNLNEDETYTIGETEITGQQLAKTFNITFIPTLLIGNAPMYENYRLAGLKDSKEIVKGLKAAKILYNDLIYEYKLNK